MKKSFTFNPNPCLVDTNYHKPSSECVADFWTIHHAYWQGFFYIIFHHALKIKTLKHSVLLTSLLTAIHITEEYFGNTSKFSLEGIIIDNLGPIFNPKIDVTLRKPDDDYIDNSIGDVTSGLLSCLFIIYYWKHYGELPYFYLAFSVVIIILLLMKSHLLYPKKNNKRNNNNKHNHHAT